MNPVRDINDTRQKSKISNRVKTGNKPVPKVIRLDGGKKYTRLFSIKNGDALSFRSGHVVLEENESIGEHNTGDSEEVIVVLEGKGELIIKGSEKLNFEEDAALYIPPNTIHDVKNTGQGSLRYVYVTCPAKGRF